MISETSEDIQDTVTDDPSIDRVMHQDKIKVSRKIFSSSLGDFKKKNLFDYNFSMQVFFCLYMIPTKRHSLIDLLLFFSFLSRYLTFLIYLLF